jgi:hypothetical protein
MGCSRTRRCRFVTFAGPFAAHPIRDRRGPVTASHASQGDQPDGCTGPGVARDLRGDRAGPRPARHRLHAERKVQGLDPAAHVARLASGDLAYDLFIGIPVHRAPTVAQASGLTVGGNDGWVAVDPRTLATRFPKVYALGNCADAPVPRAGVFAETAARAVTDDIAAKLHGCRRMPTDRALRRQGIVLHRVRRRDGRQGRRRLPVRAVADGAVSGAIAGAGRREAPVRLRPPPTLVRRLNERVGYGRAEFCSPRAVCRCPERSPNDNRTSAERRRTTKRTNTGAPGPSLWVTARRWGRRG